MRKCLVCKIIYSQTIDSFKEDSEMNVKQKLLALIVLTCCAVAFGQTNEVDTSTEHIGGGVHKLTLSLDLNTGTLVNNTTGILSGNGLDFGLEYQHRLQKLQWLAIYGKISFNTALSPNNANLKNLDPDATAEDKILYPEYYLNGFNHPTFGLSYIEGGVRIADYGHVALRSGFMILAEARYPVSLPASNSITPYLGVQAYPYLIGSQYIVPPNDYKEEEKKKQATAASLKDLFAGVRWQMAVIDNLDVGVDLSLRTNGNPSTDSGDVSGNISMWNIDSPAALKYNLSFRGDATVKYRFAPSFQAYLGLRYLAQFFVPTPEKITGFRRGRPTNDIMVRLGCTYSLGK